MKLKPDLSSVHTTRPGNRAD